MTLLVLSLVIGAEPLALPAWNADIREAAKHAALSPEKLKPYLRYVTDYTTEGLEDAKKAERLKAQRFAVNLTSREAVIAKMHRVKDTCYVVDLRDFGWKAETWEALAKADPYFHHFAKVVEVIETKKKVKERWGVPDGRGGYSREYDNWVEKVVKEEKVTVKAVTGRGIDPAAIKALIECTGSEAPIVRLDWLVWMQSGQDERAGAGYYDFLGVKSLKDFEELVGLDRKLAERFKAEVAAIIKRSGVGVRPRQVWRFGKIGGDWWESRDVFRRGTTFEERKKIALTQLDGKFEPDAFEVFATLPNRLYALAAVNNKGELQAIVPNTVAGDHFGKGNNYVIEPGMKCLRCHTQGLQPLDDYARKFFRASRWKEHNHEERKRLEQIYLGPIQAELKGDVARYESAVQGFGYKTIAECHAAYAKTVEDYEADLDAAQIAKELGVPKEELIKNIKRTDGLWGRLPAPPLSRRDFEIHFDLYLEAMGYR